MMINLGTLKEITDLRSVWPHEALNFTPWVAENVDLLADAVGLDITVETLSHKEDYDYDAHYDLWHQIVDQCDWDDNNWDNEEFTKEYDYDLTAEDVKQTIKKYDKSLSKDFIAELKDMWGDDILEEITDILKEYNLI